MSVPQVYIHTYLGCLCVVTRIPGILSSEYMLMTDDPELPGYGLALIHELFIDDERLWQHLGEL